MHQLEMNPRQVATLAALAGAGVADHSPLPRSKAPDALEADDPDFAALVEQHALQPHEGSWRLNVLAGAVLFTCAQPEEVLALRPLDPAVPSLFACRRGELWVECEVAPGGTVRLVFPFTRDFMITTVLAGLGGDRSEPPACGFHFRGTPEAAFVLASLAEALGDGTWADPSRVEALVLDATRDLPRVAAFSAVAGPEPIDRLATDLDTRHTTLRWLVGTGHLEAHDGQVRLSPTTVTALGASAQAGITVERWTREGDRPLTRAAVQAYRSGDRILAFQVFEHAAGPVVEWSEVGRAELRLLVAATLMPPERLTPRGADAASTPAN